VGWLVDIPSLENLKYKIMAQWISENKEWLFSGLGVTVLVGFFTRIWGASKSDKADAIASVVNNNSPTVIVNTHPQFEKNPKDILPEEVVKSTKSVLFIDDDDEFKIVKILKRSGWKNVEIVVDIKNMHTPKLVNADIIFVDIQGVGKAFVFDKEGLGLAKAIKEKYPTKRVVIYSAVPDHDIFADELNNIDGKIRKTAEPYEFQKKILDLLS
jgi:hypothetical protein